MVKSLFLELPLFSYYSGSRERHFQSTLPVNISLLPYEKQRQAPRINTKEALAFISHFIVSSIRTKWNRIRNYKTHKALHECKAVQLLTLILALLLFPPLIFQTCFLGYGRCPAGFWPGQAIRCDFLDSWCSRLSACSDPPPVFWNLQYHASASLLLVCYVPSRTCHHVS